MYTPAYVAAALSAPAALCPPVSHEAIRKTVLLPTSGWQVSESAQLLCARMRFVIVVPAKPPLSIGDRDAQCHTS